MALTRPTLDELIVRSQRDLITSISTSSTVLRKSVVKVIGKVLGAMAHLIYGYLDNISKELFVSTCTSVDFLKIHGKENNVARKAATFATGIVSFTGITGTTIPAHTACQSDSGMRYTSVGSVTIGQSGSVECSVIADESGASGNSPAGSVVSLVNEIAGIEMDGETVLGITGGSDIETVNSWKSRILYKKRKLALGGSREDWIEWVKSCPTLSPTRVWIEPRIYGPKTIGVYFVFDNQDDILPTESNATLMNAWLDSIRPVNTIPYVITPTLADVSFTIRINPFTQAISDTINASLTDLFLTVGKIGGTILLSDIREAVSYGAGTADNEVYQIRVNNVITPIDDITFAAGCLPIVSVTDNIYQLRS